MAAVVRSLRLDSLAGIVLATFVALLAPMASRADCAAPLAHVISTVREGVLLVDRRARIRYANPAAARLLGRTREELLGAQVADLGIARELLHSQGTAKREGVMSSGHELHLVGADARQLSILLTSSQVALHDDALTVCILQDVTELRRLECRLFSAASEERDQIGVEIHEGLSQELTGISLLLKGVAGRARSDQDMLEYLANLVSDLIENSRALAQGLSPVQSERGSLADALFRFAEEQMFAHGVRITCRCDTGKLKLGPWQADHMFRIAKGCMDLALRDRREGDIAVNLRIFDDALTLAVSIDHAAGAENALHDGLGWETIVYLAKIIGGTAQVEASPNGGVRRNVSVTLTALATSAGQKPVAEARTQSLNQPKLPASTAPASLRSLLIDARRHLGSGGQHDEHFH